MVDGMAQYLAQFCFMCYYKNKLNVFWFFLLTRAYFKKGDWLWKISRERKCCLGKKSFLVLQSYHSF